MSLHLPLTNSAAKRSTGSGEMHRSRSFLWRGVTRYCRSLYRRCLTSFRKHPRAIRLSILSTLAFLTLLLLTTLFHNLYLIILTQTAGREKFATTDRERGHFHRLVHVYLKAQKPLYKADLAPCSWVYLEVNAYDGRDLRGFFTNANGFFEESLRAELSPSRAFCAVALEPDEGNRRALLSVRQEKGLLARRFDVFPGVSAFPTKGALEDAGGGVVLSDFIRDITLPRNESGNDAGHDMVLAVANRHRGNVFVRVSGSLEELYRHMEALESGESGGVLCGRVDRLVLNVTADARDPRVAARSSPSSEKFSAERGVPGLAVLAKDWEGQPDCRTRVFVTDQEGKLAVPQPIDARGVFYSILAGAPTFDERVSAQTDSWLKGVPVDRVAIYTNVERTGDSLRAAQGRPVVVVEPNQPKLEQQLELMQSWSHLVRVRETWDRYMKGNPDIKWLALVDDDTLVFPAGMREYLTMLDHRRLIWGGSGELARIDNGDHGEFAHWLRNLSKAHGARHCYVDNEDVPEGKRGFHTKIQKSAVRNGKKTSKRVSAMCGDAFCRHGCPSVPQGAAIVLSRALVEQLRPKIEACEAATSTLCQRCGSQRLYMCANRYLDDVRTLMTRGICRAPWKLEHRHNFPYALTYHAFTRNGMTGSMTGTIRGDMAQLWELGEDFESRAAWEGTIPMPKVADFLGCGGISHFNKDTDSCEPFEDSDAFT